MNTTSLYIYIYIHTHTGAWHCPQAQDEHDMRFWALWFRFNGFELELGQSSTHNWYDKKCVSC